MGAAAVMELAVNHPDLHARLVEAQQHGWRGEIAGLEVSIDGAQRTLATMSAIADRPPQRHPVSLGMPGAGTPPSRGDP